MEIEVGNFLDPPHLLGKARLVIVIFHIGVLPQGWPTCWSTPFSMPRSYFHTRASVISSVSRGAATMPSLPPPTQTSTSTSPRSTSWTRWTGSCRTWCAPCSMSRRWRPRWRSSSASTRRTSTATCGGSTRCRAEGEYVSRLGCRCVKYF